MFPLPMLVSRVLWLLVAAACLLPGAVSAQETTGNIEGRVLDERRSPLAQAHLLVVGPALQGKRVAWTDDQGYFRVPALPVGLYIATVSGMTYRSVTFENVRVQLGATTTLGNIRMDIAAHEVQGTTTVAARQLIDPASTSVGGNLTSGTYTALPSDRDYQSIVTLVPGANGSSFGDRANLSGATGPETAYFVDGVNVVQPPSNSQSISLPHNFLREVEVREGGYEAEFGGVLGGIVNAVTASGGNEFHGQAFGFYANRLLTSGAKRGAAQTSSGYLAYDMGASEGGPLLKDRLWFFLAGNPTSEHEDVPVPGFGDRTDRQRAERYSAKITWKVSDNTHVDFTAVGDPTRRDQVGGIVRENGAGGLSQANALGNLDPYLGEQRKGGTNFSVSAVHILTPKAFMEATLSRADSRASLLPTTALGRGQPLFIDTRTGFVEGGFGTLSDRKSGRTGARLAVSYVWRRHSFKAGAEYSDEFYRTFEDQSAGGLGIVLRIRDSLYQTTTYEDKHTSNHNRIPAGFFQDSWQVGRGLELNAGLRWSAEYWISSGGDVGQRITNEWQPRVGLTYVPGERGRQKLFASYGRTYQPTRLNTPQLFLQDTPNLFSIRVFNHDPRQDPTGGTTVFSQLLGRQSEVKDLEGAHHDDFQLGYEHLLSHQLKIGIRGRYRSLRQGIVGVISPATGRAVYGNPGAGIPRAGAGVPANAGQCHFPRGVVGLVEESRKLRGLLGSVDRDQRPGRSRCFHGLTGAGPEHERPSPQRPDPRAQAFRLAELPPWHRCRRDPHLGNRHASERAGCLALWLPVLRISQASRAGWPNALHVRSQSSAQLECAHGSRRHAKHSADRRRLPHRQSAPRGVRGPDSLPSRHRLGDAGVAQPGLREAAGLPATGGGAFGDGGGLVDPPLGQPTASRGSRSPRGVLPVP